MVYTSRYEHLLANHEVSKDIFHLDCKYNLSGIEGSTGTGVGLDKVFFMIRIIILWNTSTL